MTNFELVKLANYFSHLMFVHPVSLLTMKIIKEISIMQCNLFGNPMSLCLKANKWTMKNYSKLPLQGMTCLSVDIIKVDALARSKISKRHFLKYSENFFHKVTHIGLEPHQIFSLWTIPTNTVTRGIQSFGWNGLWLAGWLNNSQNLS